MLMVASCLLYINPHHCLRLSRTSLTHSSSQPPNIMAPAYAEKRVCVMDASTPLGSSLVDRLLSMGYTVHAAGLGEEPKEVVTEDDRRRLKVFRSDPFDYRSILHALRGCSALFYNFQDQQGSYDEFMAEVEVRAAHNVLEACAQTETIERVVFTSSVTAVVWKENREAVVDFDERDWSEANFCRKYKLWHALAKTLSERTAWALAMDRGVDMVSINAGLLLSGTGLTSAHPYLKGAPEMYEDGVLVTVDLRFLVDAHIATFESSTSYGRYLCFNNAVCRPEDAVKLAKALAPSATCPPQGDDLRIIQQRIHNKKLNKVIAAGR